MSGSAMAVPGAGTSQGNGGGRRGSTAGAGAPPVEPPAPGGAVGGGGMPAVAHLPMAACCCCALGTSVGAAGGGGRSSPESSPGPHPAASAAFTHGGGGGFSDASRSLVSRGSLRRPHDRRFRADGGGGSPGVGQLPGSFSLSSSAGTSWRLLHIAKSVRSGQMRKARTEMLRVVPTSLSV